MFRLRSQARFAQHDTIILSTTHLGELYFTWRGAELIILLAGGDKTTQARDIAKARKMALEVE